LLNAVTVKKGNAYRCHAVVGERGNNTKDCFPGWTGREKGKVWSKGGFTIPSGGEGEKKLQTSKKNAASHQNGGEEGGTIAWKACTKIRENGGREKGEGTVIRSQRRFQNALNIY